MRDLAITKPDRVYWPRLGLTKRWLLEWYASIAPVLIPHVAGHPVTLHRFPEGVDGPHWYQTRAPSHPDWVRTITFRPARSGKVFDVVVLDDVESVLWAAQIGSIELHPYLGTVDDLDHPTVAVFDLDPGAGLGTADAARAACLVREVLDALGVDSYAKTSGRGGMHVVIPLDRTQGYDEVKRFVRATSELLVREHPGELTATMSARASRAGKVLLDWSQNDPGKSTVAAYSLRAMPAPTVSMPVPWAEVASASPLVVTAEEALARVATSGDVASTVEPQRLPTTR